jgi:hypothetical protein
MVMPMMIVAMVMGMTVRMPVVGVSVMGVIVRHDQHFSVLSA